MCERLVVVGDPEMGDQYLAEIVDDSARGHDPPPDPIVKILGMLRYPDQRAIMPPHPAHETPPLRGGLVCRLPVLRPAAEGDRPEALDQAIREAMGRARTQGERDILERHLQGDIRGRRSVVAFSARDLEFLRRHCAGGVENGNGIKTGPAGAADPGAAGGHRTAGKSRKGARK